jgi:hypothetical protein
MKIERYKLVGGAVVLLIVLLISFYVFEFDYMGNTLNFSGLVWRSMIVALLVGLYLGWRFHKKGEEQVDRIRIWSVAILLPLFFTPWLASLTNRAFATSTTIQSVEFIEAKPFANSFTDLYEIVEIEVAGCFIFIYYQGKFHRLKRSRCTHFNKERGDIIKLPMKQGLWGYEVVQFK